MVLGRVLIVEDETFSRTILATSLQALGFEVVGACATASDALGITSQGLVEVALLDLDLGPGPSGVDIAYALREQSPTVGIVFLTSFSDPRFKDPGERALPVGSRFLVKSRLNSSEDLRTVLLDARRHPLRSVRADTEASALTELQIEVLRLVAAGESNARIADVQGVSEKAVERTVQRISDALGLSDAPGNRRVLLARAYAELSGKAVPGP
jgi:DNA-binding NarL/FixJ family response regulator